MITHRIRYTCDTEGCRSEAFADVSLDDLMALRLHAARRALQERGWLTVRCTAGDRHYCPTCLAHAPDLELDDTAEQYAEAPTGLHLRFAGGVR